MAEIDELRARIAELEGENAALRESADASPVRSGRARTAVAVILIILGLLLAPVAAIGTWARLELVDTERFVSTFAPLADDPAVQAFVADEVTTAIDENVDIEGMVADVIGGIAELGLPPRATAALGLLEVPAAQGIRSLIGNTVDDLVASPAFSNVWEQSLRLTHERALAVIQGDPEAILTIDEDGTLSVRLDPIAAAVKAELSDRGVGFADAIPSVERQIPIAQASSLVLVRTLYNVAVAVGFWLPWAVLGLLVAGVALTRSRLNALAWTAAGFAAVFALLASGIGVGSGFFVAAVSPSVMPAAAADALFTQLTALMLSAIVALAVLGALAAVGAWLAGSSRPATLVRESAGVGFAALRSAGDRHGVGTGRFGALVDRWRTTILVAAAVIGGLIIFTNRPPTVGGVASVVAGVAVVFLLVELLRRPQGSGADGEEHRAEVRDQPNEPDEDAEPVEVPQG